MTTYTTVFWAVNALSAGAAAAWLVKLWWFRPYGEPEEDEEGTLRFPDAEIPAGIKLDLKREDLRWLGPRKDDGHDWAYLDGLIYTWSESNVQYETAWWLRQNGLPIETEPGTGLHNLVEGICRQRPFDPRWLVP